MLKWNEFNSLWIEFWNESRRFGFLTRSLGHALNSFHFNMNIGSNLSWTQQPLTWRGESIYTGELSSKFDEFLAVQSQFDSDHGVNFYVPTCCQSAISVRPLFAFYCRLFFMRKKMLHFASDVTFTLRDWWICVIDKLRCTNDGATTLWQINR